MRANKSLMVLYALCSGHTASLGQSVATGFDYPVGRPLVTEARDNDLYYNAQDFGVTRHLGEDWNGNGGGDTDLGDPVFSVANGTIISARNEGRGWGNVVIIEHTLPPAGTKIRSLYGHLDSIVITAGDVAKGQQIGTIGRGYDYGGGVYDYLNAAHLHFEIRLDPSKKLGSGYSSNSTGWTDPSKFIDENRNIGVSNIVLGTEFSASLFGGRAISLSGVSPVLAQQFTITSTVRIATLLLELSGLDIGDGNIGTAWITNAVGPGTTEGNVLWRREIVFPNNGGGVIGRTVSVAVATDLVPGNYYLLLSSSSVSYQLWVQTAVVLPSMFGTVGPWLSTPCGWPYPGRNGSFPPASTFVRCDTSAEGSVWRFRFQLLGL